MDPVLGRFASEDPAGDGGNWFAYCGDNPVNMVDKDGKTGGPPNSTDYLEVSTGQAVLATALIWFASIAKGGIERGSLIFGLIVALGGFGLIYDGLKDCDMPQWKEAMLGGALSVGFNYGFNKATGSGTRIMTGMLPGASATVTACAAYSVILEVYTLACT